MNEPLVSVIMRSFNEGWALRETLPALQAQSYRNWELIVVDSGSTDGSVELIRAANPQHFIQIESRDYNPSRVMNLGMRLASSEFGIFLNADATPVDGNWLAPLVGALQDPRTAAVFGRQLPRPNCQAVYAHDYERCFGPNRESAQWEHFFSMVSSGLRKDIWAQRGFLEQMQYSEDDEYTRWCRAQGYRVEYCPESVVVHSHNYTPEQAYKRSYGEAKAVAAVWTGKPEEITWPKTFALGWLNDVRRDFGYCLRERRLSELGHAARIRWQQRKARVTGFRAGWEFYRRNGSGCLAAKLPPTLRSGSAGVPAGEASKRFTIDGDDKLEESLRRLCGKVLTEIKALIPEAKLEALVLGGGYGRGEGGVLKTQAGDRPYNDLEFYVFLRGNRLLNERSFNPGLEKLGQRLSNQAGLHVEFKIDSLPRFRAASISLFSYDLVSGHRTVLGPGEVFQNCEHHRKAENIPLSEASRLLLNRCTGLLLVRELLTQPPASRKGTVPVLTNETEADFAARNIAKAQLALGDALLIAAGDYHWSCRERAKRMNNLFGASSSSSSFSFWSSISQFEPIRELHAKGVEFKLHPQRSSTSLAALGDEHRQVSTIAAQLWLWLEGKRLNQAFPDMQTYALNRLKKCPEVASWRNMLLSARVFGLKGLLNPSAGRYPRERLFNSLPLLLWNGEVSREPEVQDHLRTQLVTEANDWEGFLAAYKQVWPKYG
ncbi:MAG TPA: glycosyltransferase [Candidatus Dormibacteraeota bacterium]|nr:glycosyltransferase [Candidatus Dormibacteraeota bacterium]